MLDHDDQAGLVQKYSNSPAVDVSNIEPVDLVWRDGPLSSVLHNRQFTAIVAAHVVEHAPDFIQFLNDLATAMEHDGRLYLIVPDKRYSFDYFQTVTDPAKVLSDHLQRRTRHSFMSFYRWGTNVSHRGRSDWSQRTIDDVAFMHPDPRENYRNALAITGSGHYVDSHENYFTPVSFLMMIEELHYLAKIQLKVRLLTRSRGCEFLAVLSKRKPAMTVEEFINLKRKLLALRIAEDFEAIAFAEWRYHPNANVQL